MKLVTYTTGGSTQAGIVIGEQVHPLSGFGLPGSLVEFLKLGSDGMTKLAEAAKSAGGGTPIGEVELEAAVPDPSAIFLLAGNYQSHIVDDSKMAPVNKAEITPRIFIKPINSVIGTGDAIEVPVVSDTVDYELEIAAVIGKPAKSVSAADAGEYIAGYVVFNDVSARQLNTVGHRKGRDGDVYFDWLIGKWCDSFAAVGPWLITSDEIPDPTDLEMSLTVNGELRQHSSAGEMIFTVPEAIEYLSRFVTIEPGALICMGTPGGVGYATNTWLNPGDVVVAEIEKLGRLENPVR